MKNLQSALKRIRNGPDETIGVSLICPVHDIQMKIASVPIQYGEGFHFPEESKSFPFARSFAAGGCDSAYFSATHGKIFQCSECIRAKSQWKKAQTK